MLISEFYFINEYLFSLKGSDYLRNNILNKRQASIKGTTGYQVTKTYVSLQ